MGRQNAMFFNNTRSPQLPCGVMMDSRGYQRGQPGPSIIQQAPEGLFFFYPQVDPSGRSFSLVQAGILPSTAGNYPAFGFSFGYRYDENAML
jgi:hypothetical protein